MKEQMILQKTIDRGDFKSGGEASSKLKDLLRKLGVKSAIARRITIVTYELEMNIVIHSDGGEIRAMATPEFVRVIAEDIGPGIKDVEKAFEPGFSTASDEIREMGFGAGMGLNNIEHYSDDLDVDTKSGDGTKISATVNL